MEKNEQTREAKLSSRLVDMAIGPYVGEFPINKPGITT
jgi:hypothetical protein